MEAEAGRIGVEKIKGERKKRGRRRKVRGERTERKRKNQRRKEQ